jgi:redox-sensitive bicupin YhaK (pirin superfamily)
MNTMTIRKVSRMVQAKPLTHGIGFQAYSVGQQSLGTTIHPFLQLDHYFMSQPTFGEHPHQGIAAVTYMFEDSEGSFFNQDSQGDRSFIHPGDLHWTQAGSGVRHDETPTEPGKVCHGIQMFVDLPVADKSAPAIAFHLKSADIPIYTTSSGGKVRVVLGNAYGMVSPLRLSTPIHFLDVTLPAHQKIEHEISEDETAFLLMIRGIGNLGQMEQSIQAQGAALFEPTGTTIQVQASSEEMQYILCIH